MRAFRSALVAVALALGALPATSVAPQAAVAISVTIAPPALPVYVQPPIPGPGYHWIPGYWAWDSDFDDYYWVPGYWARPPRVGLLWTPGWWGWNDGVYVFHDGYWGSRVGFYGGVVYGFGYDGVGFDGGYWRGGTYFYNRSVTNVSINITNVYNRPMALARPGRVSFNGGTGGIQARPTPEQLSVGGRVAATPGQMQHIRASAADRTLRAKANHGAPPVTALPHAVDHGGTGPGAAGIGAAGAVGGAVGLAAGRNKGPQAGPGAGRPQGLVGKPGQLGPGAGRPQGLAGKPGQLGPGAGLPQGLVGKPGQAGGRPIGARPTTPGQKGMVRPLGARSGAVRPVGPRPGAMRPAGLRPQGAGRPAIGAQRPVMRQAPMRPRPMGGAGRPAPQQQKRRPPM
jgi:hypothetical protein